jgi:hypothetical protein
MAATHRRSTKRSARRVSIRILLTRAQQRRIERVARVLGNDVEEMTRSWLLAGVRSIEQSERPTRGHVIKARLQQLH